ncbi:hypothetical protein WMY93_032219 [Mugilogobius chulae]|uniref:Leucine-rich repeat and IQ domain-containing protein 1 n=1 Tax=Mugilogobius chulae TaxID=88201 RepID=A0AAW0MFY9_9GOBI
MTEADGSNTDTTEDSEETDSFYEEEAPGDVPASLLSYFENSRSRAVLCERLILRDDDDEEEEDEDFTELDSDVDFSSPNKRLDAQQQLQISSFLTPRPKESFFSLRPHTEEADGSDVEKVLEIHLTEENQKQNEGETMEREKQEEQKMEEQRMEEQRMEEQKMEERRMEEQRMEEQRMEEQRMEEQRMEEQRRQREEEFEEELRRLKEAEQELQAELQLETQRAQHKLEQEMLLQQEMLNSLRRRVEEESLKTRREQIKFELEKQREEEEEERKRERLQRQIKYTTIQTDTAERNPDSETRQEHQEKHEIVEKSCDGIVKMIKSRQCQFAERVVEGETGLSSWIGGFVWSGLCLPEETEQKRLRWMRECEPWSRIRRDRNRRSERRTRTKDRTRTRRRSRAGAEEERPGGEAAAEAGLDRLTPLPLQTLLQDTAVKLTQLTSVDLQDVSSFSLSSLSSCVSLCSLTLRRCGLKSLEHVKHLLRLSYIDVQENEISSVDCENMKSLLVLRLGHNLLRSTKGLRGAENLRELDLSHNRITRLGAVESMSRLQILSLRQNQLTSSSGLSALNALLHLDLSGNLLVCVQELNRCALLWSLKLSGNSLTQPPDLKNQALLRELHLDNNNISSLHSLTHNWLPMMQHLNVAQNSLTELPSLSDFISLETLDLRFNCLSELSTVSDSLKSCPFIRDVCVEGNPLQQEPDWRCSLQTTVPGLRRIDGLSTRSGPDPGSDPGPRVSPVCGSFLSLCQNQLQQIRELQQRHDSELRSASSALEQLHFYCRHLDQVLHLAQEQRFEHEYGEMSTSLLTEEKERGGEMTTTLLTEEREGGGEMTTAPVRVEREEKKEERTRDLLPTLSWLKKEEAEEQSRDRHSPTPQPTKSEDAAEEVFQHRRESTAPPTDSEERERAAALIQAGWRGVCLRRRLRCALARAHSPDPAWDESLEEPELEQFVLDQASLEFDWSGLPDEDLELPLPTKVHDSSVVVMSPHSTLHFPV